MTSTCSSEAPAASTVLISSANREKSAERIEGAMSMDLPFTIQFLSRTPQRNHLFGGGVGCVGGTVRFRFRLGRFTFWLVVGAVELVFARLLALLSALAFATFVLAFGFGRFEFVVRLLAFAFAFALAFAFRFRFGLFSLE